MLPLRAVSEAVGAKVDWDGESKTAVISTEGKDVDATVEETTEGTTTVETITVDIDDIPEGIDPDSINVIVF